MITPVAGWHPSLRVFLRRCIILGTFTLFAMAAAGWAIGAVTGYWQALYVGPVLALAYNILFDDPLKWGRASQNSWQLDASALIHYGTEGETYIPLSDIIEVKTKLGGNVMIFLKNGLRLRMAYLEDPDTIVAKIRDARARLTP